MSKTTQEVIDRLRRLVDDQEGGDAVVLVQRQLFNRTVGRIEAQAKRIAELEAALKADCDAQAQAEAGQRIAELEAALERAANALQKAGEMYAEQEAREALGKAAS